MTTCLSDIGDLIKVTKTSAAAKNSESASPVVMLNITSLYFASEAPPELGLQVRHSDDGEGMDMLEASIRTLGVIVPLVIKEHGGRLYVIAGNRRLKIVRKIFDENGGALGRQPAFVPTVDADNYSGDSREIAMATNIALPPHPVDRYEVIAALVREGMSPGDAMLRFGLTNRQYVQTMKLGTLAPELRDKWRSGEIDASAAQAFTLTDDMAEQLRIYKAIVRSSDDALVKVESHQIKSRIVPDSQRELGSLVEFLGVEELDAQGLIKQRDWFGSNHVVTDPKAVKKMATVALEMAVKNLIELHGWSWAAIVDAEIKNSIYTYRAVHPDKKGNYTAEQKSRSGCFVEIDRDGKLKVDYGRVKPEPAKKAAPREHPKKDKSKATAKDDGAISRGLALRLAEQLQRAGAEALKTQHAVAASAVIAAISSGGHVLNIQVGSSLSKSKPASFIDVFTGAMEATPQQQEAMFGQIAAQALHIPGEAPLDDTAVDTLFGALTAASVSKLIAEEFDAKDYFASISHSAVAMICNACLGHDTGDHVAKMKKPAAAKFAASKVPATGWLPKQLRTVHYKGIVEADSEKPAEKPPAKKAAKKKGSRR